MRILFLAKFSISGGTRESFKQLLSTHEKLGHTTHVLVSENADGEIIDFITKCKASYSFIKKRGTWFRKPYLSLIYDWIYIHPHIKSFRPDIVVCSTGSSSGYFYPLLLKVPYVLILHTMPRKSGWKSSFFYRIPKFTLHRQNYITTVSKSAANRIEAVWDIPGDKINVLYNSFDPRNVAIPEKDSATKIILTLGHVHNYKNPETWLNVAKNVTGLRPDVCFIWLGGGGRFSHFHNLTKNEDRIHFLGYKENPAEYYRKATIYFQPSILESHGRSVIDAMANGIACVTSNAGGLPDSVQNGINGFLCDPNDVVGYTDKIVQLLENNQLREKMGTASEKIALSKFHPELLSKRVEKLYKKATS